MCEQPPIRKNAAMRSTKIILAIALILTGCTNGATRKTATLPPCTTEITVSSHFTDIPLPEGTCPFSEPIKRTTTKQIFTLPLPYRETIQQVQTTIEDTTWILQEQPETTIGTQKMWTAHLQKNKDAQNSYLLTITNQNQTSFEVTAEETFLILEELTFGDL